MMCYNGGNKEVQNGKERELTLRTACFSKFELFVLSKQYIGFSHACLGTAAALTTMDSCWKPCPSSYRKLSNSERTKKFIRNCVSNLKNLLYKALHEWRPSVAANMSWNIKHTFYCIICIKHSFFLTREFALLMWILNCFWLYLLLSLISSLAWCFSKHSSLCQIFKRRCVWNYCSPLEMCHTASMELCFVKKGQCNNNF